MKKLIIATALCMVASLAAANGPGGHGGPGDFGGPHGDHGPGPGLIVGSDGTAYIVEPSASTSGSDDIVAISTSGAVAWRKTVANAGRLELSGANLISVAVTRATTTTAASSTITAYAAASGAQAWTLTLDGIVVELRPFSGGTYAIVITPPATAGGSETRQLVGISAAGTVLFKTTI